MEETLKSSTLILGGMGTLVGPLIGTAIIIFIEDIVSTWFKEAWMLCVGAIYVLCVLYSPEGVAGIIKKISVTWAFTKFINGFRKDVYLKKN